jgi:tRNA A37 methylthiotransferase MiaB
MNRPYTKKDILKNFSQFQKKLPNLQWGTDIIVGFPNETEKDFLETLKLCQQIGFKKIHTFRFSPRSQTPAKFLAFEFPKLTKEILSNRSKLIRSISQTKPPSHQIPEN